jgi:hypothetical protein
MWRFSPFPAEEEKAKTVFTENCLLFHGLLAGRHTWIKVTIGKGKP